MYDLLSLILSNITTHPDEVRITQTNEEGREVFTIQVHPDDMGRVIGKSGKVIQAIRSLAHVVAIRQDTRYRINVAESDDDLSVGDDQSQQNDSSVADDSASDDQLASEELQDSMADDVAAPDAQEAQETVNVAIEETSAADLISGAIDLTEMDEEKNS